MVKTIVLSTRVSKDFADNISLYCDKIGISSSSLLRALLEEEVLEKKTIRSLYRDLDDKFQLLNRKFRLISGLVMKSLESTSATEAILLSFIEEWMLDRYKGSIPLNRLERHNAVRKAINRANSDLEFLSSLLEEWQREMRDTLDG